MDFVNLEGHKIIINGHSQADAVQDNGIVYQSEKFDYLLDLENEIIQVNDGEIYLPLMFYKEGICDVGNKVVLLATFLILLPFHLATTLNDPSYMKTLGMGEADILVDIQQTDEIKQKLLQMDETLQEDARVKSSESFVMGTVGIITQDGKAVNLKGVFGDHQALPIQYTEGRAPENEGEIALSQLYMDDLEVKNGDTVSVENSSDLLQIVGIYSDISNGGKTAKLAGSNQGPIVKGSLLIQVHDQAEAQAVQEEYAKQFPYAKVSTVQSYIDQAFGPVKSQTRLASRISLIVSIIVIALVILLSGKLFMSKDRRENSLFKSIGFTSTEISNKYLFSFLILAALACFLGILLANSLGGLIATAMIKSFGVSSLQIVINPLFSYLLCPLVILLTVAIFSKLGTRDLKELSISENMNEVN